MSGTRRWCALLAAVLVAGLAGCAKIDASLTITGDTVSGTVITALDRGATEQLDVAPEDVFADQDEALADLDGVTAAPYDDGTWVGTEYTFHRVHLDDLNQMSEDDPDGLRIHRDRQADTYTLTMVMDLAWLADLDEEPDAPDAVDMTALVDRFIVRIAVTFPGEVTEHNGQLAGSTVTWRPPPRERTELHAISYAPEPSGPDAGGGGTDGDGDSRLVAVVLVAGLGVLVLAAAGLGISWLVRRRQPVTDPLRSALSEYEPTRSSADDDPTQQLT